METSDWVLRLVRDRQAQSREQVITSQRVELLDAMAREVAEKGYARTSEESVAARAGVPLETFRFHYQDLQACFLASYDLCVEILATDIQAGVGSANRAPLDRFESLLVGYLDVLEAEPAIARTFLIEVYAAGPRALQRRFEVLRRFSILFGEIFRGRLDPFACEALVGAISSLVTSRVGAGDFDQLMELREPLLGFVERLLLASDAEAAQAAPE